MNKQILSYLYLAIGLANVVSWIFFEGAYNHFTKPLLMPILMLYLYERFKGSVVLDTLLIFAALVFSWLGDLALMISEKYFLLGVGSFFIAQLLYIRLFYGYKTEWNTWINWKSMSMVIYGALLLWKLIPPAEALKIPVAAYGVSLISMALFAINSKAINSSYTYLLCVLGAALFVLSDSMIAVDRFLFSFEYKSAWIMSTYIAAQFLLVEGLTQRAKAKN